MYGSRKDTMFEIYRNNEIVVEVPDVIIYTVVALFVITIFKLASKIKK